MADENITFEAVRARLGADARIPHPTEIAVSVRGGTVTLRGSVGSFNQRRAAVQVARSAPRVRKVVDELAVDVRDHWEDNELRGTALQALILSESVPEDWVDATVADAWLTLKGKVKHQHESDAAFAAVSDLPGLGGITNRIMVISAGMAG